MKIGYKYSIYITILVLLIFMTSNVSQQTMSIFNPGSNQCFSVPNPSNIVIKNNPIQQTSRISTISLSPLLEKSQINIDNPNNTYKNQITTKIQDVQKNTSISIQKPEYASKTWGLLWDGEYVNPKGPLNNSKSEIYINPSASDKNSIITHELGHKLTLFDTNQPMGYNFTVPTKEENNSKMIYNMAKNYNPIGVDYVHTKFNETHDMITIPKKEFSEQMRSASGNWIQRKMDNVQYGNLFDNKYTEPINEYKARAFVNYAKNPAQFSQKYPLAADYFDQRLNVSRPQNLTQYKDNVNLKMVEFPKFSNKNLI